MALLVKNKLGFIEGTCLKISYKGELANQWERCNAVTVWNGFKERFNKSNLTRFYLLWIQIGLLKQCTYFVTSYYTKIKDLWDEIDLLVPAPGCYCEETRPFIEQFKNLRLLQFLVGLNESNSQVRSQILLKIPVLTVNHAYALVIQEESQCELGVLEVNREPLTMTAGQNQGYKAKKIGIGCEHCGYKGYLKENCYKSIGYPPDFKRKKKQQGQGNRVNANMVSEETAGFSQGQFTWIVFTESQYKQILDLLNKTPAGDGQALMAGITRLLSNTSLCEWIIDTGASHHITCNKEILTNLENINQQSNHKVQVPTGSKCSVTHKGNASILGGCELKDVLYVHDFKFNMLSVSKLTKELRCCALFFPDFCVLQGHYNGKVMGIGREDCGLYIL
ncbi:hypothetical protein A4A49_65376, partial [Nicotiana attenuata]